ncbi:nuclear transport factor 2 family protein, partial [Streptomyces sp. Ag109_O5-10]|uniref:nuclear transport factor 2 family protein n=1 Tax=Streptomyces sp. Ag109_O5-10 TaxID=1855349 RepID=UPI0015A688E9
MVTAAALLLAGGVATGTATASSHHSHDDKASSASTASTVRTLADIQDIEKLKARYFQDIDTKQWADLQALFTPDAHINTGQEFNSPAELVKATKTLIADAPTAHQGLLPNITVKGDTATGTWVMEDYVNLKAGGGFHGYGQYHDTYQRIDGRWVHHWIGAGAVPHGHPPRHGPLPGPAEDRLTRCQTSGALPHPGKENHESRRSVPLRRTGSLGDLRDSRAARRSRPGPHSGPRRDRQPGGPLPAQRSGRHLAPGPPYIPGMETAGVLDEIGPESVTGLRVGDRVTVMTMPL